VPVNIPSSLLNSLASATGFDAKAFLAVHEEKSALTSIRLNPKKPFEFLEKGNPVPWSGFGYYLASRPSFTFDPLFHAGCYYVQEASSMLLEQVLKQWGGLSKSLRVLDLCAAPGGKSTHIQSLLNENSFLVSNEVIRSRASILKENIIKWGVSNVVVTNNDPEDFEKLGTFFDVIVVDAPCSGSGLFRKDEEAITEWSEDNVQLCSMRQRRILASAWKALKPGGLMIYSTCSFSLQEDEVVANWLVNEFKAIPMNVQLQEEWGWTKTSIGYRAWPYNVKGEGFYLACVLKADQDEVENISVPKLKHATLTKAEKSFVEEWMLVDEFFLFKVNQTVFAWPTKFLDSFSILLDQMQVVYSGIKVGELVRNKLVPDHALAMSGKCNANISILELNKEQAIKYLQKKDLGELAGSIGWNLVCYQGNPLGWANKLAGRINNYYPKELRILKDL
jgi:16S rRNA C967 or C1407 C5-methylase (RsmB/RsmF family)/NOL1/NOP2/fmu family ribosome biogenesis protein